MVHEHNVPIVQVVVPMFFCWSVILVVHHKFVGRLRHLGVGAAHPCDVWVGLFGADDGGKASGGQHRDTVAEARRDLGHRRQRIGIREAQDGV